MKKYTFRRMLCLLLMVVLLVVVGTACSQSSTSSSNNGAATEGTSEVPTIKIGCIYGVTGNLASVGQQYFGSLEAAADIVNNIHPELKDYPFAATEGLPNLGGAKIELVLADTQSNPEIAATETERLINEEGVVAVIGGHMSSVVKTATIVTEKYGIPFMNGAATSPALTERGMQYYFRASPHDGTHAKDMFDFLDQYREKYGLETITIVVTEDEYGVSNRDMWLQLAKERNYKVVENITFPSNPASVTVESIRISKANADVVLMAVKAPENILYTKAFKELNITPKVIIGAKDGFINPDWFAAVGDDTEYYMSTNAWSADISEHKPFTEYIGKLVEKYAGVSINSDFTREIDSFMVLMDAINRAGTTDSEAIQKAFLETDLGPEWLLCPWEGVKFDEKHQNIYSNGMITQVKNGVYTTVFPDSAKTTEPVIPFPSWSGR